jgi:uncharacterized protein
MSRPQKRRQIGRDPGVCYFKPRGVPLRGLKEVALTVDEYESIRLADLHGLAHEQAGNRMGVSRATFGRILQNARQTIANALVNGMAIRIEGGNYQTTEKTATPYICQACGSQWDAAPDTDPLPICPKCDHSKTKTTS